MIPRRQELFQRNCRNLSTVGVANWKDKKANKQKFSCFGKAAAVGDVDCGVVGLHIIAPVDAHQDGLCQTISSQSGNGTVHCVILQTSTSKLFMTEKFFIRTILCNTNMCNNLISSQCNCQFMNRTVSTTNLLVSAEVNWSANNVQ